VQYRHVERSSITSGLHCCQSEVGWALLSHRHVVHITLLGSLRGG
jgi:hypothetical protein